MTTLIYSRVGSDNPRRCDATCHDAKEPQCVCICGGRYHGKGSDSQDLKEAVSEFTREVLSPETVKLLEELQAITPAQKEAIEAAPLFAKTEPKP